MNISQKIAAVRDSQFGMVVLFPVRAIPAVGEFFWDFFLHSVREWKEWKYGKVTKIQQSPCGDPWLPNGQQH